MSLIETELEKAPNFRPMELIMAGMDDAEVAEWMAGTISCSKEHVAENHVLANILQDLIVSMMTRFQWVTDFLAQEIDPDHELDPYDYAVQFIEVLERSLENE